jgi:hypothetical protein
MRRRTVYSLVEIAIITLNAVTAHAGHHIDAEHAAHMVLHGEMVIEALGGSGTKSAARL